jgi:hypothetical protein
MAAKKVSPAMEFIVEQLKKNRKISYAEVKEEAEAKKIKVFPIMFGRAQALLGIVKMSPRGQGKAARAKAAAASPEVQSVVKRGPGRPRKNPVAATSRIDTSSLDGIIAAVRSSEQAKARYRAALEKIQTILGSALEG